MFTEHEIINDLENRRRKNRRRWKVPEQCRQVVLELDVDWADFRRRFSAIDVATANQPVPVPRTYWVQSSPGETGLRSNLGFTNWTAP